MHPSGEHAVPVRLGPRALAKASRFRQFWIGERGRSRLPISAPSPRSTGRTTSKRAFVRWYVLFSIPGKTFRRRRETGRRGRLRSPEEELEDRFGETPKPTPEVRAGLAQR